MEILSDTVFRGANVTLSGGKLSLTDGVSSTPGIELAGGPSGATFRCGLTVSNSSTLTSPTANINTVRSTNIDVINLNTCNLVLNHGENGMYSTITFSGDNFALNGKDGQSAYLNVWSSMGSGSTCGDSNYAEILTTVNFDTLIWERKTEFITAIQTEISSIRSDLCSFSSNLKNESIYINFDVPADCTVFSLTTKDKFYYNDLFSATMMKYDSDLKFGNATLMAWKPVDVDVLVACQAVGTILVRKSSSFAMNTSDSYVLNLIYTISNW